MTYEKVIYSVENGVARITMNDPKTRNSISQQMGHEILDALGRAAGDARAVVLTGAEGAFSTGANLKGLAPVLEDPQRDVGLQLDQIFNPILLAIKNLDQPVVTSVRGAAAGVGATLAMAGDLIVCADDSFFLQAFCNIGLVPDGGSSWLLTRAVGRVRAMQLMMLGERLPAPKALEWGLVNFVVPDGEVEAKTTELVERLASGPRSLALIKKIAWAAADDDLERALSNERFAQREAGRSADFVEGVTAFVEKRPAQFKGS